MNAVRVTKNFNDLKSLEILAKEAFLPKEYLSPDKLMEMQELGDLDFWGLYDKDQFVGFTVVSLYKDMCYLFFLAIDSHIRSKGYGSKTLALLDELYSNKQQVVDFEMIDESAPNNEQRISRKAFYIRNGYKETGKFLSYLGVDYEILCKSEDFDFETFKQMMSTFHIENFDPRYFEK